MVAIIRLPWELKTTLSKCEKAADTLTAFIERGKGVWLNEGLQLQQQVQLAESQLIQVRDAITSCIATMGTMRRSDTRELTRDRLNNIVQKLQHASALCVDGTAKLHRCYLQYKKEMTTMDVGPYISHSNILIEAKWDYQALSKSVTKCCQMALDAYATPLKAPDHTDTELLQLLARLEGLNTMDQEYENLEMNGDKQREDLQRAVIGRLEEMLRGIVITEDDKKSEARSTTQALVLVKQKCQKHLNELIRDCLQTFNAAMVSEQLTQWKTHMNRIKMSPGLRNDTYASVKEYIDGVLAQIGALLFMVNRHTKMDASLCSVSN